MTDSTTIDDTDDQTDDGELASDPEALSIDELKDARADELDVNFDPNAEQTPDIYEELHPGAEDFVLPQQADEFTCGRCFLVLHRSRRVPGKDHCRDCD